MPESPKPRFKESALSGSWFAHAGGAAVAERARRHYQRAGKRSFRSHLGYWPVCRAPSKDVKRASRKSGNPAFGSIDHVGSGPVHRSLGSKRSGIRAPWVSGFRGMVHSGVGAKKPETAKQIGFRESTRSRDPASPKAGEIHPASPKARVSPDSAQARFREIHKAGWAGLPI